MPFLIDGHNLIGRMAEIDLHDPDKEMILIKKLEKFLAKNRKRAFIYFDRRAPGSRPSYSIGRLKIRFISHPRTADSAIESKLLKLQKEAKNYTVVSSDSEVVNFARSRGAQVLRSEEFAEQLIAGPASPSIDEKSERAVSPEEVSYWENIFLGSGEDEG
ncbi:MAG: NYN domain-containing protein [Chloroflexi bacterium]|nr:NYN domain-containing protein [Chloroflexota bacterium]